MTPSAMAQTLTVIHAFSSLTKGVTNQDGNRPMGGLAEVGTNLYGTTLLGGAVGSGSIFTLGTNGAGFNAIRFLTNTPDAAFPESEWGGLNGTCYGGGIHGTGAILSGATNGVFSVTYNFDPMNPDEATNDTGASPSGLLAASGGNVYGTTANGGANGNGVVFAAAVDGSSYSVLHSFSYLDSVADTNSDGAAPWGGVVLAGGTLFGTTSLGGANGAGTIFCVNTDGSDFATLYSFSAPDAATGTNTDGAQPCGGLTIYNGVLYGTTLAGGFGGSGVVFSIGTNGTGFSALHQFGAADPIAGTNLDGANPCAPLLFLGGYFYGGASAGGAGGSGTIFSIAADGSRFTPIYAFAAVNTSSGVNPDGAFPVGRLLAIGNAVFGTAAFGGASATGTVFQLALPLVHAAIAGVNYSPSGGVTLNFLGSPGSTNVVQSTTDLASGNWLNVSTNVADGSGAWQFIDPNPSSLKFYRSYTYAP